MAAASLNHSWPVLVRSLEQCRSNLKVVEKTGKAITNALHSAGKASAGLLPQILETVAAQFQQTQHPCMLYIASELLKTYGKDAQYQAALGKPARYTSPQTQHPCTQYFGRNVNLPSG